MAKFVVFEGIDGSGKTTLIEEVRKNLEEQGLRVGVIKSLLPDTEIGVSLRKWISNPNNNNNALITTQFLAGILEANIRLLDMDKYNSYDIIISDRWIASTYVYGLYKANPYDDGPLCSDMIKRVEEYIKEPDLTVYVRCDPKIALTRITARDTKLENDVFTTETRIKAYADNYDRMMGVYGGVTESSKKINVYHNDVDVTDPYQNACFYMLMNRLDRLVNLI